MGFLDFMAFKILKIFGILMIAFGFFYMLWFVLMTGFGATAFVIMIIGVIIFWYGDYRTKIEAQKQANKPIPKA
jgi:hypothetical protein